MSAGKYSPTVHSLPAFESRCIIIGDIYDRDGYDMYGYDPNGVDRDGKTDNDYLWDEHNSFWTIERNSAEDADNG